MNYSQNHKKKKRIRTSYIWAGLMSVCALAALFAAVWVVITVYEKIAGDSGEWANVASTQETTALEINQEEVYGWITDETGSRYREEDGSFAINQWKIWDNKLYYLKEDGYMACEEVKIGGQVFSFREDGALEDIQLDQTWTGLTGDDNLQNLNSLVKSNAFWCYLSSDASYTGSFKPICYRKTTETREEILGGDQPELSTPNSMQIHNGYIYYLPQVSAQNMNQLNLQERQLCNKLFRMKPGDTKKELLAEGATGFLVLEDSSVYYAAGKEIKKVDEGSVYAVGEQKYRILVRDNGCYLVDSAGSVVSGDEQGVLAVDDRVYTLEQGRIKDVKPGERRLGNAVFTLEPDLQDQGKNAIYKQEDGGSKAIFAQAPFGINSFCIAQDKIYCSAFVEKGEDNTRYSQIYRISADGSRYEEVGGQFEGNILNLYYYPDKQKIYGEYTPVSWISCYGQIVVLDLDGTMKVIDDSSSRGNSDKSSNELMNLLMVDENLVTVYLQTCEYSVSKGGWSVLSEKPFQFADTHQQEIFSGISAAQGQQEEEGQEGNEQQEEETRQSREEEQQENPREEQTQAERRTQSERETQSRQETQTEKRTQESQETQAEKRTQESRETQAERSTQSERESHSEQSSRNETTAPQVPSPPAEERPTEGTTIPRPAEPGDVSPTPAQTWSGPGDSIPTVEANPAQGAQGNAPSPDGVQYIGPGGP